MTSIIDDSIWPDGEVLTEYVICKAVYKINPRKAAILYPKPFVEKLDELIAKRDICAPSLRDLVLLYKSPLAAPGNVLKTSFSAMEGGGPESEQLTNDAHRLLLSVQPTVADEHLPASPSPTSADARYRNDILPSIDDEARNVLSEEHPKTSVRKVWFSPVEERCRRSSWNPSAIPRKSLLKKRWHEVPEQHPDCATLGTNESLLPYQACNEKIHAAAMSLDRAVSTEDDVPATSEKVLQDPQMSQALTNSARECNKEGNEVAAHEKSVEGHVMSMINKQLRKRKASEVFSLDLDHHCSIRSSLNLAGAKSECSSGESILMQHSNPSAEIPGTIGLVPQDSSESSAGSHTSADHEATSSDLSVSADSVNVSEEKQERKSASNECNLPADKPSFVTADIESGSTTSTPPIIPTTCKTSSSRRKQRMPQRFQTSSLDYAGSVREGRDSGLLSDLEYSGSSDVRLELLQHASMLEHTSALGAASPSDLRSPDDTSSAPLSLKTKRKSRRTGVFENSIAKSPEELNLGHFECPLCSNRYANARSLRAHVVRIHREVVEDNGESSEKEAAQSTEEPSVSSGIVRSERNESDGIDQEVLPSPITPYNGETTKGILFDDIPVVGISPSTPSYVRITGGVDDLLSYLICPFCKAIFVEKMSVEKHMKAVHPKLSYCRYDMERDGKCELDELKVKEILAKLMCAYCEYMCTRQSHLRQHQKRVHPSLEARPYDFDKDGKIDLSAYVMQQDFVDLTRLEMTTLKSVVCATCKRIFCKPNALSRHISAVHKDSALVTWKENDEIDVSQIGIRRVKEVLWTLICYECKRAFADPTDLKRHRRRSHIPTQEESWKL
ncbi:hypothetical protein Y032_0003g1225 [Ancylostoma ceylanicum]|uniref:C2H2-type domain-containing protein n=1 Tax=Ancylostoma ceylanicum TaxID=53326 RepID=A0A016VWR2_9BILA|nr:hypothetical protein Y032_0003g1225 [Ancylostoma ceylanicum]